MSRSSHVVTGSVNMSSKSGRPPTGVSFHSAVSTVSAAGRSRVSSFLGTLQHDDWFGGKTIGMFGGVALLINNITGPGVPSLPNMFAEAGWLFPTVCFLGVWLMTSLSTGMYCEAMRRIPGNDHFKGRVEYTSIVKYFFGRWGYIASQVGLNGALQALNIISVVQSAQVMDTLINAFWGQSCALNLSPFANTFNGTVVAESADVWSCMDVSDTSGGSAWGCHVVISLGLVAAAVITLPMGYFNLDDNIVIQVGAFVLTLACWAVWFLACWFAEPIANGTWHIPAVNNAPGYGSQAGVLGTILFNFGFVTTVPSWVNEKRPEVSVNKSVWLSTFLCNVIFFVIGIPGAMAFQAVLQGPATNTCATPDANGNCASDLMAVLTSSQWSPFESGSAWATIVATSSYMFPVVAVMSSIPVFSIVIKYNCVENGLSHGFAFFWGVLAPWIIAVPLVYQPNALNQFISFSSLLFVSFTDFIVPCLLYIALMREDTRDEKLEQGMASAHSQGELGRAAGLASQHSDASLLGNPHDPFKSGASGLSSAQRRGLGKSVSQHLAELPLLPEKPQNTDAAAEVGIPEHYAFPPEWEMSRAARIRIASVLVFIMAVVAIAGIYLSIATSITTSWDCAAVSA